MARLWLILLLAGAFTLATLLDPAGRRWSQRKAPAQGVVAALLGESRRLFANHFFIQSDVYLHSGYYPSIFDYQDLPPGKGAHSEALRSSSHEPDEHCSHNFLGAPRNGLDAFGRNFFPAKHTHLGDEHHAEAEAREILPWIKFAAEMDPQRAETFAVGAFWLRQLKRTDEALAFLREGRQANPDNYEILFELGDCYAEKQNPAMARNLWELALRRWHEQQDASEKPDLLSLAQVLTSLARLEVRENHRDQAVLYLEQLKKISPVPGEIQKRIQEVKAGLPFEADPPKSAP
jgi:tetratricopeptide (TPR) repeat protein